MAVAEALVAKNKADEERAQSALISLDVLKMARAIVGIRGGSAGKLISDHARPALRKIIKEMTDRGEFIPEQPEDGD